MKKTVTLFVVQSCADAKDPAETIASFIGSDDVVIAQKLADVNAVPKFTDWYAVLYDDERVDEPLAAGLEVFIEQSDAEMLVLIKKSGEKYYKCPRLFRRHVALKPDTLMPMRDDLSFETVLNGFIHDNDQT
jgi:hypothetical protein